MQASKSKTNTNVTDRKCKYFAPFSWQNEKAILIVMKGEWVTRHAGKNEGKIILITMITILISVEARYHRPPSIVF